MITADNINLRIGKESILENISISLNRDDITAIIGPSGCGKTSFCRTLSLLQIPTNGSVFINERRYDFPSKKVFSKPYPEISFVFQQLNLWPHLTNKENIILPAKLKSSYNKDEFNFFVDFFGIDNQLNQYPSETSVGQKQRIAILRSLLLNPKYIFLDEITSALDIVQVEKMVKLFDILKNKNVGCSIVTHDLNFAAKVATKIIFMRKGKIEETGNVNILKEPHTKSLQTFVDGIE